MAFLDKAGMMRTAMDMANVARDFVSAITQIKTASRDLQNYATAHADEVPLELHDLILQMEKAAALL